MTCADCTYSLKFESCDSFFCRRYPPRMGGYPIVGESQVTCGEFQPRDGTEPKIAGGNFVEVGVTSPAPIGKG